MGLRSIAMLAACWLALALGQSIRGAAEMAEYPMKTVPTNKRSDLAIASMVAAVVLPFVSLVVMFWLKEKAWCGACYLIGGLILLAWVYGAYITL
mmetsp:Transcript_107998/g.312074  ORF Transcript_107998/g.312074 Transcript_107998/m.312074 type:complete len:95 (-) Transcript_107998:96-380(-)